MEKIKLEKLSSSRFIYELHSMDNSYKNWEKATGYCDSKDNSILSKINMMCVMFEDMEDERELFWIHVPYSMFNDHFEIINEVPEEVDQSLEEYKTQFERTNWEHLKEDSKARFLFEHGLSDMFEKNIKATQDNADGLMHFVKLDIGSNCGWWSFDKEESEMNPEDVKVVNQVGGYHYRDFTKPERIYTGRDSEGKNIYEERVYEFISCKSRRDLPEVED